MSTATLATAAGPHAAPAPSPAGPRVLVVSDLHFGLRQYDWLAEQAPKYDLVIIAGDLLDIAGHLDLDSQITVVGKYLRTISERSRLLVCSGNHDGDEKNAAEEYVARWLQRVRAAGLVVDGAGTDVGGWRVSVCPWWDGPTTRQGVREFLQREAAAVTGGWLWVHHAPPHGVPVSWTGREDAGDRFLNELIAEFRPAVVLSGHIHNSPFRAGGGWVARLGETWVFNAGRQLGAPPTYIELDLGGRSARWVSQAGVEEQSLR